MPLIFILIFIAIIRNESFVLFEQFMFPAEASFSLCDSLQHTVKTIMQMRVSSISDYFECFARKSSSLIERQVREMISLNDEHLTTTTNLCEREKKKSRKGKTSNTMKNHSIDVSSLLCRKIESFVFASNIKFMTST